MGQNLIVEGIRQDRLFPTGIACPDGNHELKRSRIVPISLALVGKLVIFLYISLLLT